MKTITKTEFERNDTIPANWEKVKLSEAVRINPMRELERGRVSKKVSMDNLIPFTKKIRRFEVAKFAGGSKFRNGDTLVARITPCLENGKTAFVDVLQDKEIGHGSTEFIVLCGKEGKTTNDFAYYLATSPRLRREAIKSMTGTSGRQRVQTGSFGDIEVACPPLAEQYRITKILSDLDSKIEVNQQMNEILEATAQAIFQHWFIEFEFPSEDGRPYKSSGGSMVYDEKLGKEIPLGWKAGRLGEISRVIMGQSPSGETYNELGNGDPFYQGVKDFGFRFPSRRVFCSSPARLAENGDILLSVRAPIGSLNIANERCCIGRGVASIRHNESLQSFLYYLLISTRQNWNSYEAEGTVFGAVTKSDVNDFAIMIPPNSVQRHFNSSVEHLDARIRLNEQQSSVLSGLRNSLLPTLMSGRIRVPVEVR